MSTLAGAPATRRTQPRTNQPSTNRLRVGQPVAPVVPTPSATSRAPRVTPLGTVVRMELAKMLAPWRVRGFLLLCLLGPALFVAVVSRQSGLPTDTVFGRWMGATGWAGSLVVLSSIGNYVLPLLTSLVAGDAFAMEDRLGTWRHLVLAVRSPRRIFTAKTIAAFTVVELMVAALGVSAFLGALTVGLHPLVGLDGQQVPVRTAAALVLLAWLCVAVATLAWAGVGLLGSVLLGRSPMGLLLPAVVALALQLAQMAPLPLAVRMALPSQLLVAWRGLFSQPVHLAPVLLGLGTSLLWTAACLLLARRVFVRRDFTCLAHDGAARRAMLAGLAPLVALVAVLALALQLALHPQAGGITRPRVERSMATSFAHLYRLQTAELGRPDATEAQLATSASCHKGGEQSQAEGPGNDWRCVVSWHLPGAQAVGQAIYQLEVAPDGRIVADGDGPTAVNGWFTVPTATSPGPNPLWQVDGLVDLAGKG